MTQIIISQGAEAKIILNKDEITKQRIKKSYRIPQIDDKIRKLRTRSEGKLLQKASKIINIPKVKKIDEKNSEIIMDYINGKKLSEYLDILDLEKQKDVLKTIGEEIGKLHNEDIIHGDLTTSNMILVENYSDKLNITHNSKNVSPPIKNSSGLKSLKREIATESDFEPSITSKRRERDKYKIFFIDFGLGFNSNKFEDKAVDIHLFKQALEAKHFRHWKVLYDEFEIGYKKSKDSKNVLERLKVVEKRGRYKDKY